MPVDDIQTCKHFVAALVHKWKAASKTLVGAPWYVGFQMEELLQQIQFENIQEECKDDFVTNLRQCLKEDLDSNNVIKVLDIWEEHEKAMRKWDFHQILFALSCGAISLRTSTQMISCNGCSTMPSIVLLEAHFWCQR